jgi:nucleotide-binding universal stress UspA family protein
MYQRILVPLDGSKRAEKILPHVRDLAKASGAEIILLRVVQLVVKSDGYRNVLYDESVAINENAIKEAEKYLSEVAGPLERKNLRVKTIVQVGPVLEIILDQSERQRVDLVAMASHGRTGLARVFYGSIAAGVIHRIDRPLLLVRSRSEE